MKTIIYTLTFLLGSFLFASCDKYLDKTPESTVTDKEVFGTYESFQGFVDANYGEVVDYETMYPTTNNDIGGEALNNYTHWASAYKAWTGDYWYIAGQDDHAFYDHTSLYANVEWGYGIYQHAGGGGYGVWTGGWRGIRRCNVALEHLDQLSDATEEEKKLLEGQIYFFRAYFHQQIIEAFGGMPYIDKVLSQSDINDLRLPRLSYQACTDKIVEDYDRAIPLLPVDWDQTVVGSQRPGANTGRATKGAAMAYKAKALLYAGSPLMNKFSGHDYSYNKDYCEKAAAAAWDLIKLVQETGIYELTPFDSMENMFYRTDDVVPWSKETIWQKTVLERGRSIFKRYISAKYAFPRLGGQHSLGVNQTYIDKFEMADGTKYKVEYDNDSTKRWENRDPRLRKWVIVDKDQWGYDERSIIRLYEGEGSDKNPYQTVSGSYIIKKFWPKGANKFDQNYNQLRMLCPKMRLADVYLFYAEAVTAAYGPTGTAPGANMTAVDAVNLVRRRAGMPDVTAAAPGYDDFMDLIRNERDVELCFEGHYWFDIRRWHIAHKDLEYVDLQFDKDWTHFERAVIKTRVFEDPKHYWFPIRRDQTFLYPEFYQNPGW